MILRSKLRAALGVIGTSVLALAAVKGSQNLEFEANRSLRQLEANVHVPNLNEVLPEGSYEMDSGKYFFVIVHLPECLLGDDLQAYHDNITANLRESNVQVVHSDSGDVKEALSLPGSPSYAIASPNGEVLARIPGVINLNDGTTHYDFLVDKLEENVPGLKVR